MTACLKTSLPLWWQFSVFYIVVGINKAVSFFIYYEENDLNIKINGLQILIYLESICGAY